MASVGYKLHGIIGSERWLNFLLDLEWIANRLAWASALKAGVKTRTANDFLLSKIKTTDRVLDLGCGDGPNAATINAHVVGVDYDPTNIELARKAHPHVEFICADARTYLQTAEPFDVLILSHVLEHIDDPEEFLRGFGPRFERIYVEVPDFDASPLNEVRRQRGTIVYTDEDHVSEFDRREIEELFSRCNLRVTDREFIFGYMRYWLEPAQLT